MAERAERARGRNRESLIIERNVLEWRFDPPKCEARLPVAIAYRQGLRVIVF